MELTIISTSNSNAGMSKPDDNLLQNTAGEVRSQYEIKFPDPSTAKSGTLQENLCIVNRESLHTGICTRSTSKQVRVVSFQQGMDVSSMPPSSHIFNWQTSYNNWKRDLEAWERARPAERVYIETLWGRYKAEYKFARAQHTNDLPVRPPLKAKPPKPPVPSTNDRCVNREFNRALREYRNALKSYYNESGYMYRELPQL
jgi:hypothetical protein